jgi:hypothetical protein
MESKDRLLRWSLLNYWSYCGTSFHVCVTALIPKIWPLQWVHTFEQTYKLNIVVIEIYQLLVFLIEYKIGITFLHCAKLWPRFLKTSSVYFGLRQTKFCLKVHTHDKLFPFFPVVYFRSDLDTTRDSDQN